MKILVTGANGYLGQGIVKELLNSGVDVIATDLKCDRVDLRAKIIETDIYCVDNPFEFLGKPDALLHLAWRDGFIHYSSKHIEDLPCHYNFLRKMVESGVNKVAVMGSMHEVGFYEGCIHENTECHPTTPYGISKLALRQLTSMLCNKYGVRMQWLRGYYIVGNTAYGSSIFSKIVQSVNNGKEIFPFTKGENQFDFLDYEDFAKQVASAVSQNQIDGIIEICSGKPEKLSTRVERFITENKFPIKLQYGAFPDRPYDSKAVWGDDSKIREIIKNKEK